MSFFFSHFSTFCAKIQTQFHVSFFLLIKNCINTKEGPQGVYRAYTTRKTKPTKENDLKKKQSSPQSQRYGILKISLTKGCSTSNIKLAQEEKENKKQDFNLDLENASSSNTTLFLSFQIAKNKQRGTALHNFASFFRMGRCSQPRNKSFTIKGQTHPPPDKEKIVVHMHHTLGQ